MTMKGYSTSPKGSELEPCHQMEFSVINRTLISLVGRAHTPLQIVVDVFYNSSQQGGRGSRVNFNKLNRLTKYTFECARTRVCVCVCVCAFAVSKRI